MTCYVDFLMYLTRKLFFLLVSNIFHNNIFMLFLRSHRLRDVLTVTTVCGGGGERMLYSANV